ncbi:MAG: amidohydrolase family protein [Clostridia bacterium]|nr:amidohydrolase family protein [Clostridia bacterium]
MFKINITDYDRLVYDKEFKNFLPDKMIDIHTHINKLSFDPWGGHNGGSSWIDLVYDEMKTEDLIAFYKAAFPQQDITPLIFGDVFCNVDQVNDYVRDEGKKYSFPTLYRTSYDMDADELEEKVKSGGFLGYKPYLSDCPPYIPDSEIRIFDFMPHSQLEKANKNGWILMMHIPRSGRLKDKVNIAQLMEIEEKYPNIKMIVAHVGRAYSKEDIGDAFDILGKTKNMFFDFSANLCDDAIRACIEAVGTKRILYGSDLPVASMRMYRIVENGVYYNIVPRGLYGNVEGEAHMRETDEKNVTMMIYEELLAFKRIAIELNLSYNDIEDVLYGNAKRLLDSVKSK